MAAPVMGDKKVAHALKPEQVIEAVTAEAVPGLTDYPECVQAVLYQQSGLVAAATLRRLTPWVQASDPTLADAILAFAAALDAAAEAYGKRADAGGADRLVAPRRDETVQ